MADRFSQSLATGLKRGLGVLRRPELMVFLPGVTLAAFWLGGERALVLTALSAPMLFALAGAFRTGREAPVERGGAGGRARTIKAIDLHLRAGRETGKTTACFMVRLDGADRAEARQGSALTEEVLTRSAERIQGVLREGDTVARLEGGAFAVVLAPAQRLDLEICIQLSARIQQALAQPISVEAQRVYVTGSVGFCLAARAPARNGRWTRLRATGQVRSGRSIRA